MLKVFKQGFSPPPPK